MNTMPKYRELHATMSKHARNRGVYTGIHWNDGKKNGTKINLKRWLCVLQFEVHEMIWRIGAPLRKISSFKLWNHEVVFNNKEKNTYRYLNKNTTQEEMEGPTPLIEVFTSPKHASHAQQFFNTCYHFSLLQFLKLPIALLMTSLASLDTHNIKSAIVDDFSRVVPNS